MAVITFPTENNGTVDVFEVNGNVNIIFYHERLELTVDETFTLINALNVQIQAVITRESPDND